MSNSESIINVVGAVIWQDGRVLAAQRNSGPLAGKWEFPGGKVEPGESPQESLRRELSEEMGIEAKIGDFVGESTYLYPFAKIHLQCYLVDGFWGIIKLQDHAAIRWVLPTEMSALDWAPADIPIVEALIP